MEVRNSVQQSSSLGNNFINWAGGESRKRSKEIAPISPKIPLALTGLVFFMYKTILNNQKPPLPMLTPVLG